MRKLFIWLALLSWLHPRIFIFSRMTGSMAPSCLNLCLLRCHDWIKETGIKQTIGHCSYFFWLIVLHFFEISWIRYQIYNLFFTFLPKYFHDSWIVTLFLPLCCCDTLHKRTSRISRDFLTKYSGGRNTELFILHTSCKHNHIFLSPVFSLFLQCKHHEDQTPGYIFIFTWRFYEVFNWEIQREKGYSTESSGCIHNNFPNKYLNLLNGQTKNNHDAKLLHKQ